MGGSVASGQSWCILGYQPAAYGLFEASPLRPKVRPSRARSLPPWRCCWWTFVVSERRVNTLAVDLRPPNNSSAISATLAAEVNPASANGL